MMAHIAELADFVVTLPLGIEVTSTFATTHHQPGQRVLEHLLEAEELEDGQVDGRVKAETTLVGTKSRVELPKDRSDTSHRLGRPVGFTWTR